MTHGKADAAGQDRTPRRGNVWLVVLTVGLGLLATAVASVYDWRARDARETATFERRGFMILEGLSREIDVELEVVRSLARFLQVDAQGNAARFLEFAGPAQLRSPAIQALEWVPRVRAEERGAHEAEMQRLHGGYSVNERSSDGTLMRAANRTDYFPVAQAVPKTSNLPAIGYDIASDPVRRRMLEQARDSGRVATSPRLRLVQESADSYALLVAHPVYRRDIDIEDREGRREALAGFALGAVRLQTLVAKVLPDADRDHVDVHLLDLDAPVAEADLYGQPPPPGDRGPIVERTLDVGPRTWRATIRPREPLASAFTALGFWLLLGGGVIASLLLGASVHSVTRNHARIEREVQARTLDLAEARRRLEQANGELRKEAAERKRSEEERQRVAERVNESQKLESLGVLAGGVAHDFNNLLVGILANAGVAKGQVPPRNMAQATLADIERAALQAADLTKQMLAFSGRGRFVVETLDLSALVHDMGRLVRASISKNVTVHEELGPEVIPVEGDGTQLRQIVMNLMTNAAEAYEGGRGSVLVETGTLQADHAMLSELAAGDELAPGDYAVLMVRDEGVGMDDKTATRIFDPFFTTKFTGRGLGLAAVRGIVRGHQGALQVISAPGEGTTVRVLFPLSRRRVWTNSELGAGSSPAKDVGTVLVIDDEETVRQAVRLTLEDSGFEVIEAPDGLAGIEAFTSCADEVSAVVLDLTMPNLRGEEAFARLRATRYDVPIVLMSGYDERDIGSRIEGWTRASFLQKPFRTEELLGALRGVLES